MSAASAMACHLESGPQPRCGHGEPRDLREACSRTSVDLVIEDQARENVGLRYQVGQWIQLAESYKTMASESIAMNARLTTELRRRDRRDEQNAREKRALMAEIEALKAERQRYTAATVREPGA